MKNLKKEFKVLIDKYHDMEILEYFFEASKHYYIEHKKKKRKITKAKKDLVTT